MGLLAIIVGAILGVPFFIWQILQIRKPLPSEGCTCNFANDIAGCGCPYCTAKGAPVIAAITGFCILGLWLFIAVFFIAFYVHA